MISEEGVQAAEDYEVRTGRREADDGT